MRARGETANEHLIVGDVSLDLVGALQPLVSRIKRQDRLLADQLVRAASSITLNVAESDYSDPGTKRSRLFSAAGSANETRAALRLAVRLALLCEDAAAAEQLLDRVIAMLWKLTH